MAVLVQVCQAENACSCARFARSGRSSFAGHVSKLMAGIAPSCVKTRPIAHCAGRPLIMVNYSDLSRWQDAPGE